MTVLLFVAAKASGAVSAEELSAIFTGLGFIGVIAALQHERQQAEDGEKEHRELLAATKAQAKATQHLAKIQAMSALVTVLTTELQAATNPAQKAKHLADRTKWAKALWEEGDRAEKDAEA